MRAGTLIYFHLLKKKRINERWKIAHSLGCGIGYGYLHRIPLRMGLKGPAMSGSSEEKSPLLAEQGNECLTEDDAIKNLADSVSSTSLDCGVPTIPTLPTTSSTSSTLQVYSLQNFLPKYNN